MKKIFFAALLLGSAIAFSQTERDTIWKAQINDVFKLIDKDRVPHGILLDYAMEFTNLPSYNGTLTDSTDIDVNVFGNIYKTLCMGMVKKNLPLPRPKDIIKDWALARRKYNDSTTNTLVLSGLYFKYSRFRHDAFEAQLLDVEGSQYREVFVQDTVWQNPYQVMETVAFSPPIHHYNRLEFDVIIPKSLFFTNDQPDIEEIQADFNDGHGFRTITTDLKISLYYSQSGRYDWVFRIIRAHTDPLYCRTTIRLDAPLSAPETVSDVLILGPGTGEEAINNSAILRIDIAPEHGGKIIKPFIVAEGFDAGSILTPEVDGGDNSLNDFKISIQNSGLNLRALLDFDSSQQYDIIYIDWQNGTNSIQHNTEVLRNVLVYVNAQKQLNGSNEHNVLLGQSMGGVIGKYGLAKMELDGFNHDVNLFIAHDSPLKGANTPLCVQYFTRHMYDVYVDAPIYELVEDFVVPILNFINMLDIENVNINFPSPDDVLTIQDTPAAVQMNYHYVDLSSNPTMLLHQDWQDEFEAMGYPQQCRNIAISNGNECAPNHGFNARDKLISLHDTHNPDFFGDLVHIVATPILGVLFDDIELALLGVIPGSSKYFFDFDLRSNPETTDNVRQVYDGRIKYEKTLFWINPFVVSHTITSKQKDAPTDYLPFDTFSGGFANIRSVVENANLEDNLPSNIYTNPKYGFVPVASALDIEKTGGELISQDYREKYAGGEMPQQYLNTGFDNFIVGYSNNFINEPHISFQARNGNWLAEELLASGNDPYPIYDCSYVCNDVEIIGNTTLCGSASYTIPDSPVPMNYEWNVIDNDGLVTAGSLNQQILELTANGDASGWVTIELSMIDAAYKCNEVNKTIDVWIGKPILEEFTCASQGHDFCSGEFELHQSDIPSANLFDRITAHFNGLTTAETLVNANWEWEPVNTHISLSNSRNVAFVDIFSFGWSGIKVRAQNSCGWSDWVQLDFNIIQIPDEFERPAHNSIFRVYPNPSSSILNLELRERSVAPAKNAVIKAELFDMLGQSRGTVNIINNIAKFDVHKLQKGMYILKINIDNQVEVHKIGVN